MMFPLLKLSKIFLLLFAWLCLQASAYHNYESPCPRLFVYENKTSEPDRWYGLVTLLSKTDLQGVWLRLVFDKPSIQLGNWFGDVDPREEHKEYLVKNRNVRLKANVPMTVRFFVKYDPSQPAPKFVGFRLNAVTYCPEGRIVDETTETLQLQTSNDVETTPNPVPAGLTTKAPLPSGSQNVTYVRPGGGFNLGASPFDEGEDFSPSFIFGGPQQNIFNNLDLNEICGTTMHSEPLIAHGQVTKEGEFPWHAAIYHTKGINLVYWCGASLVSRSHAITVAHCVTKWRTNVPRETDSFAIYFGKYYLNRFTQGIQERLVAEIIPHPEYNPQRLSNDIAIVKLGSPVEITEYVRPICLWRDSPELSTVVNKLGTVVGWGIDERGRLTERLMQAKMPVAAIEACIYSLPTFGPLFATSKTYCAGFRNGTSVCNGDSGGGMVFPIRSGNQNGVRWYLRGLVSLSIDLENRFRCDASHFVVFTDAAKYLKWIMHVIQ